MDKSSVGESFLRLVNVMKRLRAPGGCPWDREQDFDSLKKFLLEEAFEVIVAINERDYGNLAEELGDLLLQVVFYSVIAEERGYFNISDVIDGITEKLIRRHPHVFGNVKVESAEDVKANWEEIKSSEKEQQGYLLDEVPSYLPALMRAYLLQYKASKVGFDWDDVRDVVDKVKEEVEELTESKDVKHVEEEFGDLLFALVNWGRFRGINAEYALQLTNEKFSRRFRHIEDMAKRQGKRLKEISLEEMEEWWQEAKKK